MEVIVKNYQRKYRPDKSKMIRLMLEMAERCRAGADEVSVVLVNDRRMAALNKEFTGREGPTDVLSFPGETDPREKTAYLGDIVISTGRAEDQARERGLRTGDEIKLLLIHGFLHLLGYDHGPGQKKMARMEKKLFEDLEIRL